ncbi:reverse transcriptase domain-containing protein [Tanacetum coccineum]|uniref:Reverse transcriptase domain-containing protein n=1 Tax=Tanacetum coccineum TaxID=301880 RepID=A0ABQ5F2I6_9ASTR
MASNRRHDTGENDAARQEAIMGVITLFEQAMAAKEDLKKQYAKCKDISPERLIMEYLVKISEKARILELKRRHLKITVLITNMPYPSSKIRRICVCTSQKTTKEIRSIRRLRKKYRLNLKNDMPPRDKKDNPNITMEEYIRLDKEKARRHGKVYNWETAKYGKIWYDEDIHDLRSIETEFPAIVFNDDLSSEKTLSCEPTVSSLNNNKIDFRILFDESDDEDYKVVFDKNSFSYKIIYVNDLKTDSENDNEKVDMPSFPSPKPKDFLTEPTLCPEHIDEFDLKDETSLSEYDEVEQNVLYFNDLFPFNIIYPDDLKSGKDNDDNKIDIIQSSRRNVNTQGSNDLLEGSHDKINKVFNVESFIMELKVNIVTWNYLVTGMLLNLIKNLYVPFGILFDPKRYYKDGVYTRMLWRPRIRCFAVEPFDLVSPYSPRVVTNMALPPRDQRHLWLRYRVKGYTEEIVHDFKQRLETIFGRQDLAERLRMVYTRDDGQELGGARRSMTWRQFILALGLHTAEEMAEGGFEAYWLGSERVIPDKGDLSGGSHLKRHTEGRESGFRLLGGYFIGHLAHHFGLVSNDGLRGLSVVTHELLLIDMGELVKLNICMEVGDDWGWVAQGTERRIQMGMVMDWVPTTTPHLARNYIVRPRRRDATYLQTQLLIAQKEEAGIQLQAEEFDLMTAVGDLDEIKEVNANCILMANLQQASTSGTQTDNAPVYDSDGSAKKEVIEIESFKSSAQHSVNDFVVINIPEEDVEPKQIILDLDDQPMWESAKTVAPTSNSAIIQLDVDDNFVINSTHLNMIRENKFDGYLRANPHDHIREFLTICNMFKYGETQSEAVKLLIFPFSLCDEAKTWFNELNEESITSWEQMRRAFINRFFPPSLFNRLLLEIRNFSQLVCESLTDAWLRLKNMLRKCHGHGLTKGAIIQIFYHGLDEPTQGIMDITAGGIFLYKSPNQAFQFIEDKSLKEEMHEMRNKYQDLRDNHDPKNHMNDDTPMCERHEANYIQSEDYQNQESHNSFSRQSHLDPNDPEKSLTELNNDVRNDLEDFKRRVKLSDHLYQCWQQDFEEYTLCEPNTYRRDLLETLNTLEAVIHRVVITYGKLQLQSQDVQINPVQAVDDRLSVSKSNWIESENNNALSKLVNETQLQQHESLVTESTTLEANLSMDVNVLDVGLAVTESNGTNSYTQDTSSSSRTYITHVMDVDIRPVNDQVPSAEVHLTAQHNVFANEQQHTDQSEPSYDTYLLEKVQSPKTRNNNKPVEPKSHTQKPVRQIAIGKRFSLNKSSAVHEEPNTPRSCLRWIPTGRIFKLAGLRWIPTRKLFDSCTSKVDSEPPNGSNDDITNPYECNQTLNVSACTLNLSAFQASLFNDKWRLQTTLQAPFLKEKKGVRFSALYLQKKRNLLVFDHSHQHSSNFPMLVQSLSGSTYISLYFNSLDQSKMAITYAIFEGENRLVQNSVSPTTYVPPSKRDYEILFQPLFDEYFNPPPCAVSPDPVAVAAPRPVDPAGSPLSTTIDQDVPSASTSPTNQEIQFQVTHQGVEEQIHGHQNAQFDNAPLLHNLPSDPSSEETTLQGVIPSNLHHLNQSFDTLTKLTKNHPLENVIGDPSRPVLIRSQLHEHAIWCYFDSNDNPIPFGGKRSG